MNAAQILLLLLKRRKKYLFRDDFEGTSLKTGSSFWTKTDTYADEEQVTNGTFTSDISGWTDASTGTGATAWNAGAYMDLTAGASGTAVTRQSTTTIAGHSYRLTVTKGGDAAVTVVYKLGTAAGGTQIDSGALSAGVNTIDFTATSAATWVDFSTVSPNTATIDTVSIKATTGLISVSGGNLVFAGGKTTADWGDPLVSSPATTRVAGRTLRFSVVMPAAGDPYEIVGWSDVALKLRGTIINSITNLLAGDIGPNPGAVLVNGTQYDFSIVLRTAGTFVFVKGGTYTVHTMIWIEDTTNAAAPYAIAESNNAAFSVDNLGIPARLWLPYALASDSFNRDDGALNGSETDGAGHAEANSGSGVAWTAEASWAISTNRAVNTPTLGGELAAGNLTVGSYYKITATEVDHFFTGCAIGDTFRATATTALDANNKVQLITAVDLIARLASVSVADVNAILLSNAADGMQQGLLLRYIDADNYIIAYVDRALTTVKVDEKAAGTWANIVSGALTYADAKRTYVRITGNKVRLYFNEALIGAEGTVTNTSGTVHGLFSTDSGNSADSLQIWPVGSGGEHAALDTM